MRRQKKSNDIPEAGNRFKSAINRVSIKIFIALALLTNIIFAFQSCGGDDIIEQPGGTEAGLYMGIIGFNDNLTEKKIGLLTNNTKNQFQSFINSLTTKPATGLYYAVDNAINRLEKATLPDDLVSVSIVTFTDGLDNQSIELNTNYASRDAYRDAVRNRIQNTKIKNLPISAYSIGIKGSDVVDINAFKAGLIALASYESYAKEVANMNEVNNTFRDIANSLHNESQSLNVKLKIPGGFDDGAKIRFTFDKITDAATSIAYIEGIFSRSGTTRTLKNIVYQGMKSSSGTTVVGDISGGYVTFTFEEVTNGAGGKMNVRDAQQWEYIASQSRWQRNSEFSQAGSTETVEKKRNAVIMLVLDCTASLGNDFKGMKDAANNFIDVILSGKTAGIGGTDKTKAQVRFQKASAYQNCTIMSVDINGGEELARHSFGVSAGTSGYYEIEPGNHIPWYYNGTEWYMCLSPNTYEFRAGRRYTVVCSSTGTFSVTDHGTF